MKPLTNREREIATLAARGLTDKAIGESIGINPSTIKVYISVILTKLGIKRRTLLPAVLNLPLENAMDVDLTQEQLAIARMVSEGAKVQDIADALSLPYETIKGRLQRIYAAVGVENMAGLAAWHLARHGRPADADIVPIAYRFYIDHHDRRGEYVSSSVWGVDRDDAAEHSVRTSTVWTKINVDDRPDAVRFSDGSCRLMTAAEIGAWPNWREAS